MSWISFKEILKNKNFEIETVGHPKMQFVNVNVVCLPTKHLGALKASFESVMHSRSN